MRRRRRRRAHTSSSSSSSSSSLSLFGVFLIYDRCFGIIYVYFWFYIVCVCVYYRENTHTLCGGSTSTLCRVWHNNNNTTCVGVGARAHDTVAFFLIDAFRLVHWGAHARRQARTHTHTQHTDPFVDNNIERYIYCDIYILSILLLRERALMIPPQVHLRRPCYDFSFL